MLTYNDRPVKEIVAGHSYQVADFRGRYVSVRASCADSAVHTFVDGRTCNYDTPFHISKAWREAGCPIRDVWSSVNPFK